MGTKATLGGSRQGEAEDRGLSRSLPLEMAPSRRPPSSLELISAAQSSTSQCGQWCQPSGGDETEVARET